VRLYTKTGDRGDTGLIGGRRVPKDHPRVDCYGNLDELNAFLGLALVACNEPTWRQRIQKLQDQLFVLGSELANPDSKRETPAVTDNDIAELESWIDQATAVLPSLTQFILPGGGELACRLHVARTVCRRAERGVVSLARSETVAPQTVIYLNRLSDLLFAWARLANARDNIADIVWDPPSRA